MTDNGHYESIQEDIMFVNCLHDVACPKILSSCLLCNAKRGWKGGEKEKCLPIKISFFASRLTFIGGRRSTKGSHKLSLANKRKVKEILIRNCLQLWKFNLNRSRTSFTLFDDYFVSENLTIRKTAKWQFRIVFRYFISSKYFIQFERGWRIIVYVFKLGLRWRNTLRNIFDITVVC